VGQLETELTQRMKVYVRRPDISVNVTKYGSRPAYVFGSVRRPGEVQLQGRKSLVEVISSVDGLTPEASYRITITRQKESGVLPLPSVSTKDDASAYVAEVNMGSIFNGSHPELNIEVLPRDMITVPRAPIVYVVGQVKIPLGYALTEKDSV